MNYYERHLGDYSKDTRWLSTYQHGVYTLLLDWYYTHEKPIPLDIVFRIVQARSGPERKAAQEVIDTFFDVSKEAGFAHNKRADIDIAKYVVKCGTNSLNAKARWDATGIPTASQSQCEQVCETDAHQAPSTSNQSPAKEKTPVVPRGDEPSVVVSAYHAALPKCARMEVMTPKRKKRIANASKLAKQISSEQGWEWDAAEFWAAYFAECSNDPWMRGEVANPKSATWKQNLDVLLAEDRFATVMDRAISSMRGSIDE